MGLLKPRTATVIIYQGDDMERLAELRRAADVAERKARTAGARRVGDDVPNADAEQAAYDAFVDEAAGRAVEVELTTIGRRRWRDLLAEHAPRTEQVEGKARTVEADELYEVNTESFPVALLTYNRDDVQTMRIAGATHAAIVEFLEDEASEGDFERLWQTAFWLNKAPGEDPRLGKFLTATETSNAN